MSELTRPDKTFYFSRFTESPVRPLEFFLEHIITLLKLFGIQKDDVKINILTVISAGWPTVFALLDSAILHNNHGSPLCLHVCQIIGFDINPEQINHLNKTIIDVLMLEEIKKFRAKFNPSQRFIKAPDKLFRLDLYDKESPEILLGQIKKDTDINLIFLSNIFDLVKSQLFQVDKLEEYDIDTQVTKIILDVINSLFKRESTILMFSIHPSRDGRKDSTNYELLFRVLNCLGYKIEKNGLDDNCIVLVTRYDF